MVFNSLHKCMEGLGNLIMCNSCKPRIRLWGQNWESGKCSSQLVLLLCWLIPSPLSSNSIVFSATTFYLLSHHTILFETCWYEDFWNVCASYPFLFLDEIIGFSLPLILWIHVLQSCGCHNNYCTSQASSFHFYSLQEARQGSYSW